jgi:hypothetical protein
VKIGGGGQPGRINTFSVVPYASFQSITPGGNGSKTNESFMADGNFDSHGDLTVSGNGSAANSAQSSISFNPTQLLALRGNLPMSVNVIYDIPVNSLNGGGSTALAIIGVSYTDSTGHNQQTFPVQVPAGQTQARTNVAVSIPVGATNFSINASVQTRAIDTAGVLTMRVYEVWVMV